jgi:hypothetical protein
MTNLSSHDNPVAVAHNKETAIRTGLGDTGQVRLQILISSRSHKSPARNSAKIIVFACG